jgi:hypothetical protein
MAVAGRFLRDRFGRGVLRIRFAFPNALRVLATTLLAVAAPQSSFAQSMTLPGKFSVGSSGSAAYNIPIAMPPGTAGLAPSLSLEYNSQGNNGLLGIGWSLGGLPSIGRCPQTVAQDGALGAVTFSTSDRFCMDGQRLVLLSGTYGADGAQYRTEVETFSEIISHGTAGNGPAWFEVRTKSGQIMQFGNTTDSLVLAQGTSTARSWALNKLSDTKGNYFTVTYTNDTTNGQAYPIEIDYTGNTAASLSPNNKVQFIYATRPDISPQYQVGSLSQTTVRLTDVKTYAGATLIADYKLSYQTSSSTSRSILTSVQLCDGSSPANCLPATSFTWQGQSILPGSGGNNPGWGGYTLTTGDFNGDGTTDVLVCPPSPGTCSLYYVNGSSLTAGMTPGWGGYQIYAADFNGDGKTDLFVCPASPGTCLIYYSTGTSFSQGSFTAGWGGYEITVADFDGDGRADIFVCPASPGTCSLYYSTGTSFSGGSFTAGWGGYQIAAADFNGDGRADLYICPTAAGSTCFIFYSTGSSFAASSFTPGWGGNQVSFGDFNGDGLADIFTCPMSPGATCYVYYSTGTSFTGSSFTAGWGGYNVAVGDFNNDGKADLMACPASAGTCYAYTSIGATFASSGFNPGWGGYAIVMGDWSGVGASGLWIVPPSVTTAQQYLTSFAPDLLTGINNSLSTTSISYAPLTNTSIYSKDSTSSYPQVDVQSPIYVVSQVSTSNGVGGTYSSSYSYAGAKLDLSGRGFLGFRQMTVKDPQTGITDITNYLQSFPYLGLVGSTTRSSGTQTLGQSTNTFQFTNVNGTTTISPSSAPYQVSLSQNVSSGSDLDGSTLPSVTTANQYDTLGNATQVAVSTSDGYSKTTNNTYTNDTTNWFLGRLTASTVTAQAPQQLGQYCSLPWGGTIANGQSVTAYSAATATGGQVCSAIAQIRTCTNGTLSGGFAQQACTEVCSLPWGGTIGSGQSVTAYSAARVQASQGCSAVAQTRTCGSTGVLSGSFTNQSCAVIQPKTVFLTSGSTWTVPADWNDTFNTVEVIGAGAGGSNGTAGAAGASGGAFPAAGGTGGTGGAGGAGGGGGAYSLKNNVVLAANATITINVGTSGVGISGGDTYFNGTSCAASSVCAKGGTAAGGLGGAASSGIGDTKFSGGSAAAGTGGTGGSAGTPGHAGSRDVNGSGGAGGASGAGGGGGGAGGPHGAGSNASSTNGGTGDVGNTAAGTNGAQYASSIGAGGGANAPGGFAGGAAGAGGINTCNAGSPGSSAPGRPAGLYGAGGAGGSGGSGGGGGCGKGAVGGAGAAGGTGSAGTGGLIVITYTPAS